MKKKKRERGRKRKKKKKHLTLNGKNQLFYEALSAQAHVYIVTIFGTIL